MAVVDADVFFRRCRCHCRMMSLSLFALSVCLAFLSKTNSPKTNKLFPRYLKPSPIVKYQLRVFFLGISPESDVFSILSRQRECGDLKTGKFFSLPFSRVFLARSQSFAWKTLISQISGSPIPTVCCRPPLGPDTVRIAYITPL